MAGRQKKKDVYTAPGITTKSLKLISRALEYIGKPFYGVFSLIIIGILFVLYWVGRSTRNLFQVLLKIRPPKIKIRIPSLPTFPKLLALKIRLLLLRIPKPRPFKFKPRLFALFLALILTLFSFLFIIFKDLPSPKQLTTRDQEVSTKIYDRNGILLYKIFKDKNRTIVPLKQIPFHVQLATLAAEDAEFYSHPGFSVRGMSRALIKNITQGELAGGSTITQQLVKNALLSSEKTIIRKIREIILAVEVEIVYSKDEILEMYLNEVSYGGTAYGIQEASRLYFDKDVEDLTFAEAALLAGLPKSPTKYSPFGPTPEAGTARQKDVVNLMVINKFITKELANQTLEENISFAENKIDIKAPHFVMYVRQILEDRYGRELVEKGGLEVITTLDYSIQSLAEKVVQEEVNRLTRLDVRNGATLVLSPKNGEILAMVGSKDYFDTASDGNVNVVTRPRQPGSSIKIVNYAYALANGYTTASIIPDSPITFRTPGSPPYSPKNYDSTFKGNMTLRNAFGQSRNVPAVRVLASYGVDKMVEMGKKMGITTWGDSTRFGLSLTLGGGDVKLIDLATAYAAVANYGEKLTISPVLKITNYREKVLEENGYESEQIIDPRIAFLLTSILSDNNARAPAFGTYSLLNIPNHPEVAVKTGTSNDLRDNLAIGYNQDYLVATWVGNNDNSPMARVASGITGATPIFYRIMAILLQDKESVEWRVPEGIVNTQICTFTGTLTCGGCPTRNEWFLEENIPTKKCSTESVEKIKEDSKKPKLLPEAASTSR